MHATSYSCLHHSPLLGRLLLSEHQSDRTEWREDNPLGKVDLQFTQKVTVKPSLEIN